MKPGACWWAWTEVFQPITQNFWHVVPIVQSLDHLAVLPEPGDVPALHDPRTVSLPTASGVAGHSASSVAPSRATTSTSTAPRWPPLQLNCTWTAPSANIIGIAAPAAGAGVKAASTVVAARAGKSSRSSPPPPQHQRHHASASPAVANGVRRSVLVAETP